MTNERCLEMNKSMTIFQSVHAQAIQYTILESGILLKKNVIECYVMYTDGISLVVLVPGVERCPRKAEGNSYRIDGGPCGSWSYQAKLLSFTLHSAISLPPD